MEDDDDAATLIARNPSKYLERLASERKERKSDSTQLLPIDERSSSTGPIPGNAVPALHPPAAGRLPRTEPPPPSRPPLSHRALLPRAPAPSSTSMNGALPASDRLPNRAPPTVAQMAVAAPLGPGMTHAMSVADDASYSPSSRHNLPQAVVPRMFPSDPSTTSPNSPHALRDAGVTEASVPAGAVGFRAPQHADPSITAPRPMAPTDPEGDSNPIQPTLFDRERSDAFAAGRFVDPTRAAVVPAPQVPQAAIETQLSAPRTRVRSTLTIVVVILAVLCSITFVLLLAAIGRTYFGL